MLMSYNELVAQFSFLNIPFLEPISENFSNHGINVKYGLFKDNIAYFYLSDFDLTAYLHDLTFESTFSDSRHTTEVAKAVREVYSAWFGAIQKLHKEKKLKGVIIDLRSNRGGSTNDSYYVLGSLAPKGGLQYGYARFKRGPGRFDYSPFMPMECATMEEEHEVIDDVPITILINCWSVSMSEMFSALCRFITISAGSASEGIYVTSQRGSPVLYLACNEPGCRWKSPFSILAKEGLVVRMLLLLSVTLSNGAWSFMTSGTFSSGLK